MNLIDLSLKRPVFVWMSCLLILVFGWISLDRIGVDRYPSVEFPMVGITTLMPGANPEVLDASVTRLIEDQVNAIGGVEHIQSKSSPGVSQVYLTFALEKDIEVAFNEVQVKVNQVLSQLPDEAKPPQIAKLEAGGAPIIWFALEGNRTATQLNEIARTLIKPRLENISGVGQVVLGGEQKRHIRVDLDIDRMNAYGLSVLEVMSAIKKQHFQLPGGYLTQKAHEYLIKLDVEFHRLAALKKLPLVSDGRSVVLLEDIADISDATEDRRQLARFNGDSTLGIGLVKISGSNTVAIVEEAKYRLENEILPSLPAGVSMRVALEEASFIEAMQSAMLDHLWWGTLLTALVMWLFLQNFRATAIISIAIPISLFGAIAVMYFSGFTFNTMTLLALLLLIGLVVDDAIVVLENIYRTMEKKGEMSEAVVKQGTRQVQYAVIAASLTLVSIFLAAVFMEGIVGRFFKEFGVVVTIGILVSLWVSLTLIPLLCARYLKLDETGSWVQNFEQHFERFEAHYQRWLTYALANRAKVLKWLGIFLAISFVLITQLGGSFMPKQDTGQFVINFKTPLGSSLTYTEQSLSKIEGVLNRIPEVDRVFSTVGTGDTGQVNQGRIWVRLQDWHLRQRGMAEVMAEVESALTLVPGIKAFVSPPPMMSGQRGDPFRFVIQGPDLNQVAVLSDELLKRLRDYPQLGEMDLDLQMNLPQVAFQVDRQKSALLGLNAEDVAQAVNVLAGGVKLSKFSDQNSQGDRFDIQLKAKKNSLNQVADLSKIWVKSHQGQLISLDTVATLTFEPSPAVIPRYDLQYAAMFYSTPSVPLSEALGILNDEVKGLLPAGYHLKLAGQAEELKKTVHYMWLGLGLSLLLVYMVLASQFNTYVQPFLILLAQPMAIAGGILALWLTGLSLDIFSMIGLVLLMGLVAKNAILLVDLTNQYRQQGMDTLSALQQACPIRLRPVLMTSLTVVFTMLPAAIFSGAGSDANAPLAIAVIGGMISSTALTLIVIPVAYSYLVEWQSHIPIWQSKTEQQAKQWLDQKHQAWVKPRVQQVSAQMARQWDQQKPRYLPVWKKFKILLVESWQKLALRQRLHTFCYGDQAYRAAYQAPKRHSSKR